MAADVELGIQLIQLKNRIAKHFGNSEWLELGTLVNQFDLVNDHPRLFRSMHFGDPDYEGNVLTVLRAMAEG
jgi:hypothetical protein